MKLEQFTDGVSTDIYSMRIEQVIKEGGYLSTLNLQNDLCFKVDGDIIFATILRKVWHFGKYLGNFFLGEELNEKFDTTFKIVWSYSQQPVHLAYFGR